MRPFFYKKEISTMTERKGEEFFNELYADDLSDCSNDLEINDTLSEDSYESNIRPPKRWRRDVVESDSDDSEEEWIEDNTKPTLQNCTNIPGATVEFDDVPSIGSLTLW